MGLNRTSDSLAKCDPNAYSSLYEVRKHPDLKNRPVTTPAVRKDTIEISRDKLKDEALSRLRHTSKIEIAQNSFMRVGKYLFVVLAFPPYLVLYGLPKWILVEGFPTLFTFGMKLWRKVQQKAKQPIVKGAHQIAQMFHTIKKMAKVLIQPTVRLALEFRRGFKAFYERAKNRIHERLKTALAFPREAVARGMNRMRSSALKVQERLTQQIQVMTDRLQEGIQWIKQAPLVWLGWASGQFQRIKGHASLKGKPLANKFRYSQQMAQKGSAWVLQRLEKGINGMKNALRPLATYYREKVLSGLRLAKSKCQAKWKRARDFFQKKHQNALAYLEQKQQRLKMVSASRLISLLLSQNWLSEKFRGWLKKFLADPFVRMLLDGVIYAYVSTARIALSICSQMLLGLSKAAALVRKSYRWLQALFGLLNANVSRILELLFRIIRKSLFLGLYYAILYAFIIGILLVWGLRSLATIMHSIQSTYVLVRKNSRS